MEQYWLPKKLDWKNLRMCVDNYKLDSLFIRDIGSHGGKIHVNRSLEDCSLDFIVDKIGLHLFVDTPDLSKDYENIFNFSSDEIQNRQNGFSLAYHRVRKDNTLVILGSGEDPYDPKLPEPDLSFLRGAWDYKLFELYFKGRIDLKFHSWCQKPYTKYWAVTKPQGGKNGKG